MPRAELDVLAPNSTPDIQIYEAKYFCELALKGNPFALEVRTPLLPLVYRPL